jgi:hypothetical protein
VGDFCLSTARAQIRRMVKILQDIEKGTVSAAKLFPLRAGAFLKPSFSVYVIPASPYFGRWIKPRPGKD